MAAAVMDLAANAVRRQLHALAYSVDNFMRAIAIPETAEPWSLTSLREKVIEIDPAHDRNGSRAVKLPMGIVSE